MFFDKVKKVRYKEALMKIERLFIHQENQLSLYREAHTKGSTLLSDSVPLTSQAEISRLE
jgi:hypothetical protein